MRPAQDGAEAMDIGPDIQRIARRGLVAQTLFRQLRKLFRFTVQHPTSAVRQC